jgi:hypothetical protein
VTPLRRLVATIAGPAVAVVAAWQRLAAAATPDLASAPAESPACSSPTGSSPTGGGRAHRASLCLGCGTLYVPRPLGSPLERAEQVDLCRRCAAYPPLALRPVGTLRPREVVR